MDDSSSDNEDFEGFVVSPEEKASYKVWTRKRRASEALSSDSDDDMSGDDDDDDDDDEEEDEENDDDDDDGSDESAMEEEEEEEVGDEDNEDLDDPIDIDINIEDSGNEMSSGNVDQCPVCLMSLKEQLLGTPNNCPHVFCFDCIQEWSKNATTCPVGRKPFSEILVHATKKGPVLQRIPVEERQAGAEEEEDDPTYCEVCGECNREARMLLCDGCDNGYHMECLTPPVEFVPLDEWFCPACTSREDAEEEQHEDAELHEREAPRARATRGRPRGSTARRVSSSGRTATTRTARTVASTRGRGRTVRGLGRSSSRGRGRGGRRSSTSGRSSSTKKTSAGKIGKRKKLQSRSTKMGDKTGKRKRYTKRRKNSKTKTSRTAKRRRVTEEDEVSPFIYEPQRRGKTVHARLLESLNSTGPSTEPGRHASVGRMPFPNRVEPSSSFALFGNAYALYDFDDGDDDAQEVSKKENQTTPWSSESSNPDVLGSIFEGLDTLHSGSTQLSRDGKIITAAGQSHGKGSVDADARSTQDNLTTCRDKEKNNSDVPKIKEENTAEMKLLKENKTISKESDIFKASAETKDKRNVSKECSRGDNIFENLMSFSKPECSAPCGQVAEIRRPQHTFPASVASSSSPPSRSPSSKSTLSGFRIPKRSPSFDSQSEPSRIVDSCDAGAVNDRQQPVPSSSLTKFKIPKRTKSLSSDDNSKQECFRVKTDITNVRQYTGQRSPNSSTTGMEHKRMMAPNLTSQTKGIPRSSCVTDPKTAQSSGSNYTRPFTRENFQRRNSLKSSASASETSVANSTSAIRCQANKINRIIHSYTTVQSASSMRVSVPAGAGQLCVTESNNVARCHATKAVSYSHSVVGSTSIATSPDALGGTDSTSSLAKRPRDIPRVHATSTSSVTPLTKVAPLIDNSKPTEGNKQRSSNIEIIKMLHEKKRSMREQMSDDPKMLAPSNSRSLPSCSAGDNLKPLPKEGSQNTKPSPSCSRGVNLPVAVVKPSPQISSAVVVVPVVLPAGTFESQSPVKSIASGIIDVHSCNTQEFKRVCSESNAHNSKGKTAAQNFDKTLTGASGDRDQQRKLGIARLQRHEQIVDEVKLALKPFFQRGDITKDDYKLIMKKSVQKIKESSSSVDRDRVGRLVKKYLKKIKGVNFTSSP